MFKVKVNSYDVRVHVTKAYRRGTQTHIYPLLILNLKITCKQVVNFTPRRFYPWSVMHRKGWAE